VQLDWLTARPIAHRGLHDAASGVIENMPAAFAAAIDGNYAIECDLQLSRDGEAMVHHDRDLDRLTTSTGPLASLSASELREVTFRNTGDRMLSVADLCAMVGGRVPLVIEMKWQADEDANLRIVERSVDVLRAYKGPAALMSFDPGHIEALRMRARDIPRGVVAERDYEKTPMSSRDRFWLAHLLHAPKTRPQFIAYRVRDLPSPAPLMARFVFGLPLLTWTVRTTGDRARAAQWASQIIFEDFRA
jgi:glycerophosphoryl diester phosphodiesterase